MKKRIISLVLVICMLCTLFPVEVFADGETADEPECIDGVYQIETAEQLMWFHEHVDDDAGMNAVLLNDINFGNQAWESIPSYSGTFDGNGHTISGLNIIEEWSILKYNVTVGMFGRLSGTVTDLMLIASISAMSYGSEVINPNFTGPENIIGAVCSTNYGTIQNVSVYGSMSVNLLDTNPYGLCGSICGVNNGVILNCAAGCSITAMADSTLESTQFYSGGYCTTLYVGGICGYNNQTIQSCASSSYCRSNVINNDRGSAMNTACGGVCAINNGSIFDCTSSNSVYATGRAGSGTVYCPVGGICAENYGTVYGCRNSGNVTTNNDSNAGGICGYNTLSVQRCSNSGEIVNARTSGGICGVSNSRGGSSERKAFSSISDCCNTGKVAGISYAGGICGSVDPYHSDSIIENCYSTGTVAALSENTERGGIAGYAGQDLDTDLTISDCCYLNTSAPYSVGTYDYNADYSGVVRVENVSSLTQTQFADGTALEKLSAGCASWMQRIGEAPAPVLIVDRSNSYEDALSGVCGPGLSWVYDEKDRCLKISGTGDMCSFEQFYGTPYSDAPWGKIADSAETLIIDEGVTSIGNLAFIGFNSLVNVSLPESLIRIGHDAFRADALRALAFPSSVKEMGYRAVNCTQLRAAVFYGHAPELIGPSIYPDGFDDYGRYYFRSKDPDFTVYAPENDLTWVQSDAYNEEESTWNDYPISFEKFSDIITGKCGRDVWWELDTVSHILAISGTGAMDNWSLEANVPWYTYRNNIGTVIISDGVTAIGAKAFCNCSLLSNISMPDSVTDIGSEAFKNDAALKSITLSGSLISVKGNAFSGCSALKSISVRSGSTEYRSENGALIRGSTFVRCPEGRTGEFSLPADTTSIGDYAFYNCSRLTSVSIPEGIRLIGDYAFSGCSGLDTIQLPEALESIGNGAFAYSGVFHDSIVIPQNVTSIGAEAFRSSGEISEIKLYDKVKNIGKACFEQCGPIKHVCFEGSREKWKDISFGADNSALTDAAHIWFSYANPKVTYEINDKNKKGLGSTGFTYADRYFETASSTYNHNLAIMSLGMAMSSVCYHENTDTEYETKGREFITQLYEDIGCDPKKTKISEGYCYSTLSLDKCGYSFSLKKLGDSGYYLLPVVIRSFGYGGEWASNFRVYDESLRNYSYGFKTAETEVFNALRDYISGLNTTDGISPDKIKIWVSGYSRGGAISNLLGADLDRHTEELGLNRDNIYVYTYAAPNVVKSNSVVRYSNIHNIVSRIDLVPRVPFSTDGWNYARYGVDHYLRPYDKFNKASVAQLAVMQTEFNTLMRAHGSTVSYEPEDRQDEILNTLIDYLDDALTSPEYYKSSGLQELVALVLAKGNSDAGGVSLDAIINTLFQGHPFVAESVLSYISSFPIICTNKTTFSLSTSALIRELKYVADSPEDSPAKRISQMLSNILSTAASEFVDDSILLKSCETPTLDALSLLMSILGDMFLSDSYSPLTMQHWPESYLAWMRSGTPEEIFEQQKLIKKKVIVKCPVDVTVYDSNDNVVARVVDDIVDDSIPNAIRAAVSVNGEKTFTLPDGFICRLEVTAREDCDVDIVSELVNADGEVESAECRIAIPMSEGQSMTVDVAEETTVVKDGVVLTPDLFSTDGVPSFSVGVESDGNGFVTGGGKYILGSSVCLNAIANEGYAFSGWISGGVVISTDPCFRFSVYADRMLKACFIKHEHTWISNGTVTEEDGEYPLYKCRVCGKIERVESLTLPDEELTLKNGETIPFEASMTPAYLGYGPEWCVSPDKGTPEGFVRVSDGMLTAVSCGSGTVSASLNGVVMASCRITVEHSCTATVIPPTCTERGYTEYTCACGDSYADSYVDALGHEFRDGKCIRCPFLENQIDLGETVIHVDGDTVYKLFIPKESGRYAFRTLSNALVFGGYDSVGYLTDADMNLLTSDDDGHFAGSDGNFYIGIDLEAGKSYYIGVRTYKNTPADIKLSVTKAEPEGECGKNAGWKFEDGVLTVYGTGDMNNYSNGIVFSPWSPAYSDDIRSVVIEEGITGIGDYSFCGLDNLTDVYIAGSVKKLGGYAFSNCEKLRFVCFGGNAPESMGKSVFASILSVMQSPEVQLTIPANDNTWYSSQYYDAEAGTWYGYPFSTCVHSMTETVTPPGCLTKGYTTHVCSRCGYSYVDTYTEAAGHHYGDWHEVKAPTCTAKGTERRDCINCNDFMTRETCALGHSYTTSVTAPTCTAQGYTTYTCSRCGDSYRNSYTAAIGHNYSYTATKAPTASATSNLTGTCSRCKGTTTVTLPRLNTTNYTYEVIKAATCTAEGSASYTWKTTTYGTFTFTVTLAKCAHNYTSEVTKPTCTVGGYTTRICADCGDKVLDSYTDPLGHSYSYDLIKDPSKGSEGLVTKTCVRCDETETYSIPKLNKTDYVYCVEKAPTCTEYGEETYAWQPAPGYITHTFIYYLPKLDHSCNYTVSREPTGNATGELTGICSVCNTPVAVTLPKLNTMDYIYEITKSATCAATGSASYTWKNTAFGEYSFTVTLAKTSHNYSAVVTAPTCTARGYTTHTCSGCGDSYVDTYVNALGHNYSYTATKTPTTSTVGTLTGMCSRCKGTTTVTLPKLNTTDYTYKVTKTATCTATGTATYTWKTTTYGTFTYTVTLAALNHDWDNGTVTKQPTEKSTGIRTFHCSRCTETKTETIPELTHIHSYSAVVTAPTCAEKGYTTHTCRCGDSYMDTYVNALGHNYSYTATKMPTTSTVGTLTGTCSRCKGTTTVTLPKLNTTDYTYKVTNVATCTATGTATYTWKTTTYSTFTFTVTLAKTSHNYSAVVTAPTCTEKGYTTHTCAVCGDSYKDSYVNALGHKSELRNAKAATCTEVGYTGDKVCTRCGATVENGKEIADLGHNWNSGIVTKQPTEESTGIRTYTCTRCGNTKVETIPELAHEHSYSAIVTAPTCTEKGYTTHTCPCGDSYIDGYVDALGHNYIDGVCTRCGAEDPNYKPPVLENPFVDIKEGSVYYDAILWAYNHKPEQITGGFDPTHFVPNNPCTRAQVVTFLWRAAGCPAPANSNNPFVDVSPKQANGKDNPYYKAILWAAERGITNGIDATHFIPNATVTRAQFVTFLWRYENEPASTGSISVFKDANQIASPYQKAVAWAVANGIAGGYEDGTFRPKADCTRWAVVLFMYRDMA